MKMWVSGAPRLFLKPSRHYISRCYGFRVRAEIILNNYRLLAGLLPESALKDMAQGRPVILARFLGKKDMHFKVVLERTDRFDREGELILRLRDDIDQRDAFNLVFSLNDARGYPSFEVGCIQGPKGDDSQAFVKTVTKELHRIRPRDLMLDVLYYLAQAWQVKAIFAVSNQARVFNGELVHANYDAIWHEMGSVSDRDGMYRLPDERKHHDLSEVVSHHRAEYRRRIAMREELFEQIARFGVTLASHPEHLPS